jgi:hypothetical protein
MHSALDIDFEDDMVWLNTLSTSQSVYLNPFQLNNLIARLEEKKFRARARLELSIAYLEA